jgi:riboflavin synthase
MFTGIVKDVGEVIAATRKGNGLRLKIRFNTDEFSDLKIDESVNCSGACQTVVAIDGNAFEVDTVAETLKKRRSAVGVSAQRSILNARFDRLTEWAGIMFKGMLIASV